MKCPEAMETIFLAIIRWALLNIRSSAFSHGAAARCAWEADHVHNLPNLIGDYSVGALKYYLGPCPAEYVRGIGDNDKTGAIQRFQPLWDQLEALAGLQPTGAGIHAAV